MIRSDSGNTPLAIGTVTSATKREPSFLKEPHVFFEGYVEVGVGHGRRIRRCVRTAKTLIMVPAACPVAMR